MHENKKNCHGQFFSLDACDLNSFELAWKPLSPSIVFLCLCITVFLPLCLYVFRDFIQKKKIVSFGRRPKWFFYTYLNSPTVHCSKQSQTICSCLQKRNRWKSHLGRLFQKQQEFLNDNTDNIYKMNDLFKHFDLIIEGNKHNKWCSKQKTNTILSNFSVEGPLTPQGLGGVHIGVIKSKCTIS